MCSFSQWISSTNSKHTFFIHAACSPLWKDFKAFPKNNNFQCEKLYCYAFVKSGPFWYTSFLVRFLISHRSLRIYTYTFVGFSSKYKKTCVQSATSIPVMTLVDEILAMEVARDRFSGTSCMATESITQSTTPSKCSKSPATTNTSKADTSKEAMKPLAQQKENRACPEELHLGSRGDVAVFQSQCGEVRMDSMEDYNVHASLQETVEGGGRPSVMVTGKIL